ncbi:MAG: ABC transporter substrate-binding protein [Firmicutes bacterium HGW-Firmicutes-2]|nr:MAG: ABC transporter substrate-binding protein [Firmicutes bacterium HGW-Firmicutes-2]
MKKICVILVLMLVFISVLAGCKKEVVTEKDIADMTFDEIVEAARGTTVTFYGWGGSEDINKWLDETVAKSLMDQYEVTLERVPMVPAEYLPKLLNEKQLNSKGTIDVLWINGENFYSAKNNDLLYGPFTEKLPNFNTYLDGTSPDVLYDFGQPVEGYEAPYGKAQMVFIGDTGKLTTLPKGHQELLELAKAHPGKLTYIDASHFTGSAFVRNIIYDIVGYEVFLDHVADKATLKETIQPALDYLKELKPYLWREGVTYPAEDAQLDNMFEDGEVYMTMTYTPFHVAGKIADGSFPETAQGFLFDKGTIGNTHFMAMPFNAPNKAAAMVLIHHILSPEIQVTKYDPSVWGDLPVTDPLKLTEAQMALFDAVDIGQGTVPQEELLVKRLPEMRADLVPIIEEIWRDEIPGN